MEITMCRANRIQRTFSKIKHRMDVLKKSDEFRFWQVNEMDIIRDTMKNGGTLKQAYDEIRRRKQMEINYYKNCMHRSRNELPLGLCNNPHCSHCQLIRDENRNERRRERHKNREYDNALRETINFNGEIDE